MEREAIKLKKRLAEASNVVRVFRCLSAAEGETWRMRCLDAKGNLRCSEVMGETPDYLDRRDFYHSALVVGGRYVVRSRLDKESFCWRDEPNLA